MQKIAPIIVLTLALFATGYNLTNEVATPAELSLLSYNIRHGKNLDGSYNLEKVAESIALTGADIVALQEVDQEWGRRSHYDKQLDILATQLSMHSTFSPALVNSKNGQYGVGILSKYPIISSEYYFLPGKKERRVLLVAGVKVGEEKVYVFNTHLGLSAEDRKNQVPEVMKVIEKYQAQNIVLMGDFNTHSKAPELAPLFQYLNEYTFDPATSPTETLIGKKALIDYVLTSKSITFKESAVLLAPSSDHYPVYAKIELPRK